MDTIGRRAAVCLGWMLCMVTCIPADATAQSYGAWYQDGYVWRPGPDGGEVGGCFGNCGAGCSDRNDGNCIPQEYNPQMRWDLEYLIGPYVTASGEYEACVPEGDSLPRLYWIRWNEYAALARYTYHGYVAPGCITHDYYCGAWTGFLGCALFAGCGSPGWFETWSYERWIHAYDEYRDPIGWGTYGQC